MKFLRNSFLVGFGLLLFLAQALAQGTAFTYQGRLTDANAAANGVYDFQFKLYSTANDSNVLGSVTVEDVTVTNGVFTVQLDFGATPFANNAAQFLEIHVRLGNQTGAYTPLSPRQRVNATPYALKSALANDALQLNGIAASQFVQTNDARLSDARTPTAGSANYIQNGAALQAASNFNISGNGTAGGTLSGNVVNATTQFNLGGVRILGALPSANFFAGKGAGANLSSLSGNNTFVGEVAGRFTTDGYTNTFIGTGAGYENTFGNYNVYVGVDAGAGRTVESQNTLLGTFTKAAPGVNNAVAIGFQAEVHQSDSIVLGYGATRVGIGTPAPQARLHVVGNARVDGDLTVSGTLNATVNNALQLGGVAANQYVQTNDARLSDDRNPKAGSSNYIQNGTTPQAASNFSISGNGIAAGTLSGNLVNAVTHYSVNNQRVLSVAGTSSLAVGIGAGVGGIQNAFFGTDAGQLSTTSQNNSFFGNGAGFQVRGNSNAFFGRDTGRGTLDGAENVFVGDSAGLANVHGSQNTFLGTLAGQANLYGNGNVMIGHSTGGVATDSNNLTLIGLRAATNGQLIHNATALGVRAQVNCSDCLVLGSVNGVNDATATANVGIGVNAPQARLHVKHDSLSGNQWGVQLENAAQTTFRGGLRLSNSGFLEVSNNILNANPNFARLDSAGNWTAVSDARRKRDITPLNGLLAGALQLHPVSYRYTHESAAAPKSIGFLAQEVEALFPALVTDGEIKTLNYAGLSVVAIGALQEQQRQITALKAQLESLKQLICAQQPQAAACQP